ncbi:hypothetical protein [Saccharopolyspora endophytica]|uniref:hypothetical protein n=1 Tax=Saccharopolyspora endophytica TaxID=543886 RepID=UPI001FE8F277|nr:hypothetical protein [Saccharopolyspora endophytica]
MQPGPARWFGHARAGDQHEVVGGELGPCGVSAQGEALRADHLVVLGDVAELVVAPEFGSGREHLRRAREVQQVQSRQ